MTVVLCENLFHGLVILRLGKTVEAAAGQKFDEGVHSLTGLVAFENITGVDLVLDVVQDGVVAVGEDHVALGLELPEVVHHHAVEEGGTVFERGFIDDHRNTFGLDAFHHALDGGSAEVVGVALHREAIHAHGLGLALEDAVGNEILADAVALHHRLDHGLRHILVVRKQLLRILGQTVATVAEARVVIVSADPGIHAHAVDDLLGIQALGLGVGVEFVEVADADGQVCIREELDGFGFSRVRDQHRNVLVFSAFLQQPGE